MLSRINALTIGVVIMLAASCLATVRHPEDEWQEVNRLACGDPCNVPDRNGNPVACRSQWGSCGNSPDHCNAKSLWTRSACTSTTTGPATATAAAGCLTGVQVADAWVATVNALSADHMPEFHAEFTPQSFCAAALAVAYGESFSTTRCPGRLDSTASNAGGKVRGLWQFSNTLFSNGMSASEQAKVVITKYSSNNQAYGCKAGWNTPCTALDLPGQQNSCQNSHVFCNNVWTGQREVKADHYKKFVSEREVRKECVAAYAKNPPTTTTTTTTTTAAKACGDPCNVPDRNGNPVACRSQWGSCGNSPDHCNAKSLWTRSACTSTAAATTDAAAEAEAAADKAAAEAADKAAAEEAHKAAEAEAAADKAAAEAAAKAEAEEDAAAAADAADEAAKAVADRAAAAEAAAKASTDKAAAEAAAKAAAEAEAAEDKAAAAAKAADDRAAAAAKKAAAKAAAAKAAADKSARARKAAAARRAAKRAARRAARAARKARKKKGR